MKSGGKIPFNSFPPPGPLPPEVRVRGDCALVEWEGENEERGYPTLYQRTFCGTGKDTFERQSEAHNAALKFVRKNYDYHYTSWIWVAEAKAAQPPSFEEILSWFDSLEYRYEFHP